MGSPNESQQPASSSPGRCEGIHYVSRITVTVVGGKKVIADTRLALSRDQNIQLIGCVNDVRDIVSAFFEEPQIVLIDFSVVSETRYAMLSEMRRCQPNARVVFLCNDVDPSKLIDAFRFGVFGYLEAKNSDLFLAKAVRAV